jgi:predicted aldo/keto reductase-like oxidoreductase
VNDLFCLARPEVHTLSLGAARPSDFDEHVAALAHYETAAETIAPIEERWRAEVERVLGREWVTRWAENLPSYVDLPGEVNAQEILRLWTYAKGLDLVEWGKMRYNLMGNAGHWFPGTNAAEVDERAMQAALEKAGYPFAKEAPGILREAHKLMHAQAVKRLSEGG